MLTTTTPSATPAPHAVWDAAIRASGQGEKQTNPSSHRHCIIPLRTGEYLNLPRRGCFHRMGERKRGEKPDCRAWVTSLFGGCPFDHWLEFEVKEAPRRRPPRLGSPSQGLGTLKPTSVPLPGTQPRCRDAAMPRCRLPSIVVALSTGTPLPPRRWKRASIQLATPASHTQCIRAGSLPHRPFLFLHRGRV